VREGKKKKEAQMIQGGKGEHEKKTKKKAPFVEKTCESLGKVQKQTSKCPSDDGNHKKKGG